MFKMPKISYQFFFQTLLRKKLLEFFLPSLIKLALIYFVCLQILKSECFLLLLQLSFEGLALQTYFNC